MEHLDSDKLVNSILALWDAGIKDDGFVIEKLESEFGISKDDAELALELTKTGLFRAQIISSGVTYPKNNLSNNQIITSALKIGLTKLGRQELYAKIVNQNKPWWKFW